MTTDAARFTGDVPDFYERYLVPVIFEPHAADLAARVPDAPGTRVLEIACGTGVLTRRLLARLPREGRLVATDLNPSMYEVARARSGTDERVEWRQADGTQLPFEDESFDAVVCQFGVMFFPDKGAGMREARRVLRPGGRFHFNVMDRMEINPFARVTHSTVAGFYPHDPPRFYLTPFNMSDVPALERLVASAGFAESAIERVEKTITSDSAAHFAAGLIRGNPIVAEIAGRGGASVAEVEAAVAQALAADGGNEPYRAPMRVLVVSARR